MTGFALFLCFLCQSQPLGSSSAALIVTATEKTLMLRSLTCLSRLIYTSFDIGHFAWLFSDPILWYETTCQVYVRYIGPPANAYSCCTITILYFLTITIWLFLILNFEEEEQLCITSCLLVKFGHNAAAAAWGDRRTGCVQAIPHRTYTARIHC